MASSGRLADAADACRSANEKTAMRIERADKSNAALVLQKVEELITELASESYSLDTSRVLPCIEQAIEDSRYVVLFAKDATGEVVAILSLGEVVAAYAGGLFGIIHELYVRSDLRSSGIGKRMVEEAKVVCR